MLLSIQMKYKQHTKSADFHHYGIHKKEVYQMNMNPFNHGNTRWMYQAALCSDRNISSMNNFIFPNVIFDFAGFLLVMDILKKIFHKM